MRCPNCDRDNPGEPKFCQFCAYEFESTKDELPAPKLTLPTDFPVPDMPGLGSVLRHGFATYFRHFGLIFRIAVAVWLPIELVKNYVFFRLGVQNSTGTWRIDGLLQEIFGTLVVPAIIFGVVETTRTGVRPSVRECLRWSGPKWGATIGVTVRAGFITLIGIVLLIVPGIVFLTWYVFVTQAVAIEDRSKSDALSRSKQLSAGHRWTILGAGVVVALVWLLLIVAASFSLALADHWLIRAAIDLVNDLALELPTVVFLMYFLHLVQREKHPSGVAVAAGQNA
ncbi:MAG: zinc ribbon domain-containing protein [Terriglobales bacterium]